MKAKYVLAILVVMITSCGPAKIAQDYQRDSVVMIIKDSTIYRDSIIYVRVEAEKDSVILPDTDTSRLRTRYAESEAYVAQGRLHHMLRNRSEALIPIETKIPVTIHFKSKSDIRDKHTVEVVEVEKQLSKWQRFIQVLGYALLTSVVLWIVKKCIKL